MTSKLKHLNDDILKIFTDLLGINYFIIDAKGNRVAANSSMETTKMGTKLLPETWATCQEVMRSKQVMRFEEEYKDQWFLSVKAPLLDSKKNVEGVIGLGIDITKNKQAELAKNEFLANMCHDIRTPFYGIRVISEILQRQETDPEKKELLDALVDSVKLYAQFLEQFIEIANLGHLPVKKSTFNLREMIEEIMSLFSAAMQSKGLQVVINCQNKKIKGDKVRIGRILLNLVGNAVKFTQTGSIEITVSFKPKLSIQVKDTGIGIPASKQKAIFERFVKLEKSGNVAGFSGLGMGLYLAQQLAMEMDGDISVVSRAGKGSTFTLTL